MNISSEEDIKLEEQQESSMVANKPNALDEMDELAQDHANARTTESFGKKNTTVDAKKNDILLGDMSPHHDHCNTKSSDQTHTASWRDSGRKQSMTPGHSWRGYQPVKTANQAHEAMPAPQRPSGDRSTRMQRDQAVQTSDTGATRNNSSPAFGTLRGAFSTVRIISRFEGASRQITELNGELLDTKRKWEGAVHHSKLQRREIAMLRQQLEAQKEARKEAEAGKRSALREFSRVNRVGNSLKTSDSDIQETWGQLSYAIKNLARYLAAGNPNLAKMEDYRTTVRHVLARVPEHLDNEVNRQHMIRVYLWQVTRKCWSSGGEGPGNSVVAVWKDLRKQMIVESRTDDEKLKGVLQWFATGWNLVGDRASIAQSLRDNVTSLRRELGPFIEHHENKERAQRLLEADLTEIFEIVKTLENMFYTAKCSYQCIYSISDSKEPLPYDDEDTEVAFDTGLNLPTSKVKFVVSPALIKHGRADGTKLRTRAVLVKAEVVLEQ